MNSKHPGAKGLHYVKNPHILTSTLYQALEECDEKYSMFSGLFFVRIIGSFEQNVTGIRARHPLCRDLLETKALRDRCHGDLVKCIQRDGMIASEDDDSDVEEISNNSASLMEPKEEGIQSKLNPNTSLNKTDKDDEGKNRNKYTVDEIACFIAELHIDEDSNGEKIDPEVNTEDGGDNCSEN